ncbi:hypothetical protein FOA43_003496 [Brettanomyces nanus]|uniref:Uncharacterized protein n=1 Tax=Eeniella nana TaxID=13502 RepID=A0A875RQ80_EENNA|nr:uncharacterized protein FOA43_003496 [Brettanomyces nanus]QPG76110.1 hypothetical protein FOA43_003496 [Brettanomyces nanus]
MSIDCGDILPEFVGDITLTDKDKKSIDLLELLDKYHRKYEDICNNIKRTILSIKRADYVSGNINMKFGKDFWDLRPSLASKTISFDEGFKLNNLTPKRLSQKERIEKTSGSHNIAKQDRSDFQGSITNVTNRKRKPTIQDEIHDENKATELFVRDPLKMFSGGFVSSEIREAKKSMDLALREIVELCTERQILLRIVKQLEDRIIA